MLFSGWLGGRMLGRELSPLWCGVPSRKVCGEFSDRPSPALSSPGARCQTQISSALGSSPAETPASHPSKGPSHGCARVVPGWSPSSSGKDHPTQFPIIILTSTSQSGDHESGKVTWEGSCLVSPSPSMHPWDPRLCPHTQASVGTRVKGWPQGGARGALGMCLQACVCWVRGTEGRHCHHPPPPRATSAVL